jgi:DNA topoisomerase IB
MRSDAVVATLRRRRTGGSNLFAYKQDRRWAEVNAHNVNDYIKEVAGGEFSAKDFRTWSGTVLAAAALAESEEVSEPRARRRAVAKAITNVAEHLGILPLSAVQPISTPASSIGSKRVGNDRGLR